MPTLPQTLIDEANCLVCNGVTLDDAIKLALLNRIAGNAGGETFYLLSNVGDILTSQVGDRLIYQ